jgi:hypothetical protein
MAEISSHSTTLEEARSLVYLLSDEEPDANFSFSAVDRLINHAFKMVARVVGLVDFTANTTTVPSQAVYSPLDPILDRKGMLQVSRVYLTDDSGIKTDLTELTVEPNDPTEGTPTDYFVSGADLVLSPVPDGEYSLSVVYKKDLTPLVDPLDVAPISSEAAEIACIYATYLLKLKDDEAGIADRWKGEYENRIQAFTKTPTGVYKAS